MGDPAVENVATPETAAEVMHLRLYVAGMSPKSLEAFANLKSLCEAHLTEPYEIEIVDLIEHPGLARGDDIIAVPTVVKDVPAPMRKVIGDLSDTERVLLGLQLVRKQY
jgi:circadian clock protein KaiB